MGMAQSLTQPEIEQLNEAARVAQVAEPTIRVVTALARAAGEAGLEEISAEGSCILYQARDGRLVNCWTEGPMSQEITEGGAGFDDQIDLLEMMEE